MSSSDLTTGLRFTSHQSLPPHTEPKHTIIIFPNTAFVTVVTPHQSWKLQGIWIEQVHGPSHTNNTIIVFCPNFRLSLARIKCASEMLASPNERRVSRPVDEIIYTSGVARMIKRLDEHESGQWTMDKALCIQMPIKQSRKCLAPTKLTWIPFFKTRVGWVKVNEMAIPCQRREAE